MVDPVEPIAEKTADAVETAANTTPTEAKVAEPVAARAAAKVTPAAPANKAPGRKIAKPVAARTPAPVAKAAATAAKPAPKTTSPKIKPAPARLPIKTPAKTIPAPLARTAAVIKKAPKMTTTTTTTEYTEKFQTALKDASAKAKAAFEKSQANLGEVGAFTKGNVEALVESTKILASGLQAMTKGYATESKTAFETLSAEMKSYAAVKSPSELLEKHSSLMRAHFDAAVAASSKNSEAMLKLANEVFQPISNRVSLAVEKIHKAA